MEHEAVVISGRIEKIAKMIFENLIFDEPPE